MYDILDLNSKKVAELKEIAEKLNIQKIDKFKKQDLVYKILDEQAIQPPVKKEIKEKVTISNSENRKPNPNSKQLNKSIENVQKDSQPNEPKKAEPTHIKKPIENNRTPLQNRDQKFKQKGNTPYQNRSNNDRHTNRDPKKENQTDLGYNFDGIIANEGVLEIMQDGLFKFPWWYLCFSISN